MGLFEDSAVVGSIQQARSFGKALGCHKALHLIAIERRHLGPQEAIALRCLHDIWERIGIDKTI